MPSSPDRGRSAAGGGLRRLRAAYERLVHLPPDARSDAARAEFGSDPAFLRELLRLLVGPAASEFFLTPPSVQTEVVLGGPEPEVATGGRVGGRWRLVRRLGSGGQGVVWLAHDDRRDGTAVVKLLRGAGGSEALHREAAALRWLSLPGVVRLLDWGRDGGLDWIAMAYVDGAPFPGRTRRLRWDELEPLARGLFETLARIHAAGVVHGDLKPQNVLVDGQGLVTVLDLGLAAALRDSGARATGGTPGYVAPERRRGGQPDVRSDLYSAGVLLCRALGGDPHRTGGVAAIPSRAAPARVRRLLRRLVAAEPGMRPASAAETVQLLGTARRGRRRRPWSRDELRERFVGQDWFLHVREDASDELWRRTGGDARLVEAELSAWLRAGLARIEGGRVATDRVSLDRIAAMPAASSSAPCPAPRAADARALQSALREGDRTRLAAAALAAGRSALAAGRGLRAFCAAEVGLTAGARGRGRETRRRLQELLTSAALGAATALEIERALWLLRQGDPDDDHAAALREVLAAAAAHQAGDRPLARRMAERATRYAPRRVRPLAWAVRALVAQSLDLRAHERAVAAAVRWARDDGSPYARRAARTWRAWLEYRRGRCAVAARLHMENARAARGPAEGLRSLLDAAVSALDAGDVAQSAKMARSASRRAASLRLPVSEARAFFTERDARSRAGEAVAPELDALDAADALGFGVLSWNARMSEAAIAWRAGDVRLARRILAPLPSPARASAVPLHELPVACFASALGGRRDPARVRVLARAAVRDAAPLLAVQCLALLARGSPDARRFLRRLAAKLRLPTRGAAHASVREFMSVAEAQRILRGARRA